MSEHWKKVRVVAAATLSAVLVGIVGVGAIAPETAQAAGVVVDRHQPYGAVSQAATRRRTGEEG